ncbi:MAG: hypothetical protein SVM79_01775 [Chloroflexota bacterium]|nr:hypothetical protein [Chloroflexota bacterium]
MAEEIGRIEKPSVDDYVGGRKLILVPLIFSGQDAPKDFQERYERYWQEAKHQIHNLEEKLGAVTSVFHEMIFDDGENGMKFIEQLNPESHQIIKSLSERGAKFQSVEEAELTQECMDWERCFMVAVGSKVKSRVSEFYVESRSKRYQHVSAKIDELLEEGGLGLLFVREDHQAQFPMDVKVFNVYPPALDEINRWLRDYAKQGMG